MSTNLWTPSLRRLLADLGFYGSVAVYRGGALDQASVTIGVMTPLDAPSRQILDNLGGGRASMLGIAERDTDIQDGDELRASGHTWIVEGSDRLSPAVYLALSQITNT